jgi:hypothetical protein
MGNDFACPSDCNPTTCQCRHPDSATGPEPPGWHNGDLIPPPGKCLHGTALGPKGINKDCGGLFPTAVRARNVATLATTAYWISVRDQLLNQTGGSVILCRFYGYSAQECSFGRLSVVNGGFDTGSMLGWSLLGDSSATSGLPSLPDITPQSAPSMNLLRSNGMQGASPSDVEAKLGLHDGRLAKALGETPTRGSVTYQTVVGHHKGDQLVFDWNLLAFTGAGGAAAHNAYVFLVVCQVGPGACTCDPAGSGNLPESVVPLANARGANESTSNTFFRQTGWQQTTHEFTYDGDSIVAIGIIDVNDTFGAHLLTVDSVTLQ